MTWPPSLMNENELLGILKAVREIDDAKDIDNIVGTLCNSLKRFGLTACLVTNLPLPSDRRWYERVIFNGWPLDWYDRYTSRQHYRFDPCAAKSRNTAYPFVWDDIVHGDLAPPARRVMDEAAELGLRNGICVPIHAPFREPAVVTAAGLYPELSPSCVRMIALLAREAFRAVSRAVEDKEDNASMLSKRECEILQWIALGKTAWEISCILNVSEHTVATHLRNIRRKLDTANIAHAVVEALRRQLIQL